MGNLVFLLLGFISLSRSARLGFVRPKQEKVLNMDRNLARPAGLVADEPTPNRRRRRPPAGCTAITASAALISIAPALFGNGQGRGRLVELGERGLPEGSVAAVADPLPRVDGPRGDGDQGDRAGAERAHVVLRRGGALRQRRGHPRALGRHDPCLCSVRQVPRLRNKHPSVAARSTESSDENVGEFHKILTETPFAHGIGKTWLYCSIFLLALAWAFLHLYILVKFGEHAGDNWECYFYM